MLGEDTEWISAAGDYIELHVRGRLHLLRETMNARYPVVKMKTLKDPLEVVAGILVTAGVLRAKLRHSHAKFLASVHDAAIRVRRCK